MEKIEEISNTVKDVAELQLQQEKRLTEVENRRIKLPDYNPILKEILNRVDNEKTKSPDQATVADLSRKMEHLDAKLPDRWGIIHLHDFSPGSKGFITGAVLLLLAFCSILAISINLWQRNNELSAHSVKYRLIRQYYPEVAAWTERKYAQDPDAVEIEVERLEAEQEALRLLETATKKKEVELLENKKEADRIRKQRNELKKK